MVVRLEPVRPRETRAGVRSLQIAIWACEIGHAVRKRLDRELGEAAAFEPLLELGGGAEVEELAEGEGVVERGALVVEHDVVGSRNAHDVVDTGGAEHEEERVHVVLVGLGVVGVANVTTHGEAEELSAEVVFEASAEDLLAVVEVLGVR